MSGQYFLWRTPILAGTGFDPEMCRITSVHEWTYEWSEADNPEALHYETGIMGYWYGYQSARYASLEAYRGGKEMPVAYWPDRSYAIGDLAKDRQRFESEEARQRREIQDTWFWTDETYEYGGKSYASVAPAIEAWRVEHERRLVPHLLNGEPVSDELTVE